MQELLILQSQITTPIGQMTACATRDGVCLLEFDERPDIEKQIVNLENNLKGKIIPGSNAHLMNLQLQITQYFENKLKKFNLPLVLVGTEFQKSVWEALLLIPFGKTETYLSLTKRLGNVKAIRAVAAANAANKMAIIVPCHRIIGSDGALVGYAGGLWRKDWLLNHESDQVSLLL